MFEEMNEKLEQYQQGRQQYQKMESMLDKLKEKLKELKNLQLQYETELEKEEVDVDKLSKMNLTSLFYTILGSKEEQIGKERQEALAAKLKYDNIVNQREAVESQISKLETEKRQFAHCEQDYEKLFQTKYEMLKQTTDTNAEKICELENNISMIKSNKKEIEEAIAAGERVINALQSTQESLDSAESWGTWDLLGGGLISDMVKHSNIDDARYSADMVQNYLNEFQTELADVKISSQINVNIEGFEKFADFFFDGLIADWIVQSRIHDSMESVYTVKSEVDKVLIKLRQMKTTDKENIVRLENELSNLIEKA